MCMNRSRQGSSYGVLNPYSPRSSVEEVEVEGSGQNHVSATPSSPGSSAQSSPESSAQSSPRSSAQTSAERGRRSIFA